jgi:Flp pilus assembly protein TadB
MTAVSTIDLLRVRAALTVGVPPSQALMTVTEPGLAATLRQVRLGRSLPEAARAVSRDEGSLGPGPLLRALALAERCGRGAVTAVDVALATRQDALADDERIRAKSAQAIGTARLLTALPIGAWALLVLADPTALGFYAGPIGWACAAAAALLAVGAHTWSRRLVRRAAQAARQADPLATAQGTFDRIRALAIAVPVLAAVTVLGHPLPAVLAAAVAAVVAGRPRSGDRSPPYGMLELVALLRMLVTADLGLQVALEHLAAVTPAPLDGDLLAIARRLRAGSDTERAFGGAGLDELGAVLGTTEHWGVAADAPLELLGNAIRARQRAAAETAAERVQLALVFPTTLLTLPAFVIAVVPPLVWTALASA